MIGCGHLIFTHHIDAGGTVMLFQPRSRSPVTYTSSNTHGVALVCVPSVPSGSSIVASSTSSPASVATSENRAVSRVQRVQFCFRPTIVKQSSPSSSSSSQCALCAALPLSPPHTWLAVVVVIRLRVPPPPLPVHITHQSNVVENTLFLFRRSANSRRVKAK